MRYSRHSFNWNAVWQVQSVLNVHFCCNTSFKVTIASESNAILTSKHFLVKDYNKLENALLRWQDCYVQLVHCSPTTEQDDAGRQAGRQAGVDP